MSSGVNKWPGRLVEIFDVVNSCVKRNGVEKEKSSSLSEAIVSEIAQLFGGMQFYLPTGNKLKLALRDARIFTEFTGDNTAELARKYNLSQANIYLILKKQREERRGK